MTHTNEPTRSEEVVPHTTKEVNHAQPTTGGQHT